jgi:CheY-like chemotaxis protein
LSTWMVVEDEPDIYDVLLAMFEIWGIEGIAFVDGAEAVSWVNDVDKGDAAGELPELAILDIRLPEISGPEVGARIRRSERLGKIAIVLITAYRLSPEEEEQVKRIAQADMLMYKPLPAMPELRKILDQIITKRGMVSSIPPLPGTTPTPPQPQSNTPPGLSSSAAMPAPAATPAPTQPGTPQPPVVPATPALPLPSAQTETPTAPAAQAPDQPTQPAAKSEQESQPSTGLPDPVESPSPNKQ